MAKTAYCKAVCKRDGCIGKLCLIRKTNNPRTSPVTDEDEIQEEAISAWKDGLDEEKIANLIKFRRVEG